MYLLSPGEYVESCRSNAREMCMRASDHWTGQNDQLINETGSQN